MNLLAELRKRNVFRVLAAYLVGSWIVMQVIGFVAEAAEMPGWIDSFVLIVVLLGLPIVGIAAWALELTPEGVKASGTSSEIAPKPIGPVDYVLIAAVIVVAGAFVWQMVLPSDTTSQPPVAEIPDEVIEEQLSIAVLPFVAISGEQEDVYLGDGLAEELLNVLAQFPDLQVAGRTSSFSFRDRAEDIPAIGEALGVSHVLEGSVRRAGNQVRVTAQLIRASDGFHIWSGNYDRPLTDILEVQDSIVRQIAQVLTIRLGIASTMSGEARATNPSAYEHYLRGRTLFAARFDNDNRIAGIEAFQTAVDIDPDFAAGWAALARALAYSSPQEGESQESYDRRTLAACERALELDPDSAEAHVAMADYHQSETLDWALSQEHLNRALELAPNAVFAHYQSGLFHSITGDFEKMRASFRRAMALDPLDLTVRQSAQLGMIWQGRMEDARRLVSGEQFPDPWQLFALRSVAYFARDGAAYERISRDLNEFMQDQFPDSSFLSEGGQATIEAHIAGLNGDLDRVRALLPQVHQAIESNLIDPEDAAYLYGLIGDHAEAARIYLEIQIDPENAISTLYRISTLGDGLRCQPDYHRMWQLPGYPELAEIRRANGATGNLPLSGDVCDEWLTEAE